MMLWRNQFMERITSFRLPKMDPLDFMVLLALAVVPFSYYLGFDLDWSEQSQAMPTAPMTFQAPRDVAPALAAAPESDVQEDLPAWNEMVRHLEIEAISYPGRVAIYLKDLKHDRIWTYRADDLFPSASLVKVPIMAAVFDKIHRGDLSLDTRLAMHRR